MRYLIDGYNLLFALGKLSPRSGKPALENARRWLAQQLQNRHPDRALVTVVFDGQRAPPGATSHEHTGSIPFLFSQGQTADDLIEDLIAADSAPRELTIVSNDHRIRQAGRRRGCSVLGCLDYFEQPPSRPAPRPDDAPTKPEPSSADNERWLREFKDLGDDPLLRDPF